MGNTDARSWVNLTFQPTMKTLLTLAWITAGTITGGLANQVKPTFSYFKVQVNLKGVNQKWFSGLQPGVMDQMRKEDGIIQLPSIQCRVGFPSEIEIIQEYSTRLGAEMIPCGFTCKLNPGFDGLKIHLSGNAMLRYPTDAKDHSTASQFVTQENLLDLEVANGGTKTINLEGGGQMLITVTMVDARGEAVK